MGTGSGATVRARHGGILSLLLPSAGETELLRACLLDGEVARTSWRCWCAAVGEPRRALADDTLGAKPLIALLHDSLRRNELAADPALRTALAAAALADEQREHRYRSLFVAAAAALRSAAIPFWVLKGAALSAAVYPPRVPRHSHDVDLLVRRQDQARAAPGLAAVGFAAGAECRRFVHESGLPIVLHEGFFRYPFYDVAVDPVTARARRSAIEGEEVSALAPADQLLQILGQAVCGGVRSLLWVCDAHYVIERSREVDWNLFAQVARAARLSLPLRVQLDYLAGEIGTAVPRWVLDELAMVAGVADRAAREVALFAVRAGRRGRLHAMLDACDGAAERRELLRWMAFPCADAIAGSGGAERTVGAWFYAARPLSYALRRAGLRR